MVALYGDNGTGKPVDTLDDFIKWRHDMYTKHPDIKKKMEALEKKIVEEFLKENPEIKE